MDTVTFLGKSVGKKASCNALAVPRATFYRHHASQGVNRGGQRPDATCAFNSGKNKLFSILPMKNDSGIHHRTRSMLLFWMKDGICSISTYYRILTQHNEIKERKKQVCRPHYQKPELLATKPNQVWLWDITKLKRPAKWTYFYLYVILDIFSRYVVG